MSEDGHVMSTADRLVYMAHQIDRNFAPMGQERAVVALNEHLTSFWDPRMRAQIIEIAREQPDKFSSTVAAAVALMAQHSRAERADPALFNGVDEAGHCDAG
ncbi:NAD-dependent formate dehydrogenase delta subunit [Sphingobium herbicidovorans NBRC 16415]|uniref:NAD-dependent formate dehydrogenase delta subunit n=1 Tax=Sphingobium herbicidovorans (strain ATCC 700291 / DSM 11019 / CCUG 56400 / KCTC 2939 / LMG 18315 / NBRC 16415 / MH) TaxID=1219045 RepID=A0A086P7H9_SPHHM|nr:formate dehydrogenase subunit delta [Sphingobium herbicidovorans]KFG89347.1 NAD-dependent formate dehydrogenase delta subunit [Sphingobium herbicidovorans NBRC 16415]